MKFLAPIVVLSILLAAATVFAYDPAEDLTYMRIETSSVEDRAVVANLGVSIDYVDPDTGEVMASVPRQRIADIRNLHMYSEIISTKEMPAGYEEYLDYPQQMDFLKQLNKDYPAITSLFSIGQSVEGRELGCLRISSDPQNDHPEKPAFFLVALHHAREILSPMVALYFAQNLLDNYGTDDMITHYIDNFEIYIVPNINPDGGQFDHRDGDFHSWRKNRSVNEGSSCRGVDLNRNYGFQWGGAGSTNLPCDLTYRGPSAFSEPETQAVRDFVTAHSNITSLISLHTFSKLVLWPWGYTYQNIDDATDLATFKTLGQYMADQNGYRSEKSSSLYPVSGETTDWAYGELGIYGFTIELEPGRMNPFGFYPDPSIIPGADEKNFNAMIIALGLSRDPTLVLSTELWKLDASLDGSDATVDWASVVETDAKAWNVYRRLAGETDWTKINDSSIDPGQGSYEYTDTGLSPDTTYEYAVEFKSKDDGLDQFFGPVSVTTESLTDDDTSSDDDSNASADDDATDDDTSMDDDSAGGQPVATGDDDDSGGCGC